MAPLCAICLFGGLAGCGLSERTLLLKRSLHNHGAVVVWRPGIASSLRERRRHCKDHHCVTASAGGKVVDAGRCLAASACVCATEAPCVHVIYIIPSPCAVLTSVPHCAHSSRYWGDWRYRDTCSVCVCSLSPGDCWWRGCSSFSCRVRSVGVSCRLSCPCKTSAFFVNRLPFPSWF